MLKNTQKFADLLVSKKLLTPQQLEEVQQEHAGSGEDLVSIITRRGFARSAEVLECLAESLELPYLELSNYDIDTSVLELLPKRIAYQCQAIPLFRIGQVLTVAMSHPGDVAIIDKLRRAANMEIEAVISSPEDISIALEGYYGPAEVVNGVFDEVVRKIQEEQLQQIEEQSEDHLKKIAEDAPVVKLVNLIIGQAVKDGASDIHICPEEDRLVVRYRIDGVLHDAFFPPKSLQAAIISRIKILAEMDIAETRTPQDGRCQVNFDGRVVDLRVSTLPTVYGENVVMRLLDKNSLMLSLEDLRLGSHMLQRLQQMLASAHGIILVTGPTGSGKTTTLYSCLNALNTPERNIITIEDPVEYRLQRIRQAQVNPKAGMTFAAGLRSILRQDPDVIMIGEIRDSETAQIAVESALTGHLVLSTLHTNDAPGAIARLVEMGVEPFLVASATLGVLAQRLVRKVCSQCKVDFYPEVDLLKELGFNPEKRKWKFYRGTGCQACKNTGYRGRLGIYEIMLVNEEIRTLCLKQAPGDAIRRAAMRAGMQTLRQDGYLKALQGMTTLEEVIRVTNVDR